MDSRKCQTPTASPAEPGELPIGLATILTQTFSIASISILHHPEIIVMLNDTLYRHVSLDIVKSLVESSLIVARTSFI